MSTAKGKRDPAFRTKLKLAVDLLLRAAGFPFRTVVADSSDARGPRRRQGWRDLKGSYLLALKPSPGCLHPIGSSGSLEEASQAAGGQDSEHPGLWGTVVPTLRDGSQLDCWVLEVVAGPSGPHQPHRAFGATTAPKTLPVPATRSLISHLPHPDHALSRLAEGLNQVIR